MKKTKCGNLYFDPRYNPAILDTCTWDIDKIKNTCSSEFVSFCRKNLLGEDLVPYGPSLDFSNSATVFPLAKSHDGKIEYLLCEFQDRQKVLAAISSEKIQDVVGDRFLTINDGSAFLSVYAATMETVNRYCQDVDIERGPRALGYVPRLGIGTRMSTLMWPAIYSSMAVHGISVNAIQNSLRELRLLSEIRTGESPREIHLHSFGTIREGHTGCTFEGLWLEGVLSALKIGRIKPYGADADHIKIQNGPGGIDRAKAVILSSRYYSFYTVDVSPILGYHFLFNENKGKGEEILQRVVHSEELRETLRRRHVGTFSFGGSSVSVDMDMLGRLTGKYWEALDAIEQITEYIRTIKQYTPFDLELSIDEVPEGLEIRDVLTTEEEVLFLCNEFIRRNIPITHLAPNFGVEKGCDYRIEAGYARLKKVTRSFFNITREFRIMLDIHSGDDLSTETRKVFRRGTGSNLHYKISPRLQELFAEVLISRAPSIFKQWWERTVDYVRAQAEQGSEFARQCLDEYLKGERLTVTNKLFHYYHFATVGLFDDNGEFCVRDSLYSIPQSVIREYQNKLSKQITIYCNDLF